MLKSSIARYDQLISPEFQSWALAIKQVPKHAHRKVWEWCYICQALAERGKLKPGNVGLGFAVGQEQLSALFVSMGCQILASDLAATKEGNTWMDTGLAYLNTEGICPPELAKQNLSFMPIDMRNIPTGLRGFDFCWSSCSFEHLGTLATGAQFVYDSIACLRSGGVAVHTTEYNVSSNDKTVDNDRSNIYRLQDIERIINTLNKMGHRVEPLCVESGATPEDLFVDQPPFKHQTHLKLNLGGFVCTSIGLIITKC